VTVDEYLKNGDQPLVKNTQAPDTMISFRRMSLVRMRSLTLSSLIGNETKSPSKTTDDGRDGVLGRDEGRV